MNIKIKKIFIAVLIMIATILIGTQSYAVKVNFYNKDTGKKYTLNTDTMEYGKSYHLYSNILWVNKNVFCMNHGQSLKGSNLYMQLRNRITITGSGLTSDKTGNSTYTTKANAKFAYLLNQRREKAYGYSTSNFNNHKNDTTQVAIWKYINTWRNALDDVAGESVVDNKILPYMKTGAGNYNKLNSNSRKKADELIADAEVYATYINQRKEPELQVTGQKQEKSNGITTFGTYQLNYTYINKSGVSFGGLTNLAIEVQLSDGTTKKVWYKQDGKILGNFEIYNNDGSTKLSDIPSSGTKFTIKVNDKTIGGTVIGLKEITANYRKYTITAKMHTLSRISMKNGKSISQPIFIVESSVKNEVLSKKFEVASKTGNLQILKVDEDNNAPLGKVTFKIKSLNADKYIKVNGNSGTLDTFIEVNTIEYVDEKDATIFETSSNSGQEGKLTISKLPLGKYEIKEINNNNENYEKDVNKVVATVEVIDSEVDEKVYTITNAKQIITLGGFVWKDGVSGKDIINTDSLVSSTYNEKDDKLVEGVIVTLRSKADNSIVELMQEDGEIRTNPTITDKDGHYEFKGVLRDGEYYVQFTYNGQIYENVEYMKNGIDSWDINSKATEKSKDRSSLNAKFQNIGEAPQSYKSSNSLGYGLIYNIAYPKYIPGDDTRETMLLQPVYNFINSEINAYIKANNKFPDIVKDIYPKVIENFKNDAQIKNKLQFIEDCKINAYTGVNDNLVYYPNETAKSNDVNKLYKINLGIRERAEFDLHVEKDLYNARVQINGKSQVYTYNAREHLGEDLWTMTVRKSDAYNFDYTQPVYSSDYNFRYTDGNGYTQSDELKIYATYMIRIRNQSTISGKVTELADYYDKELTYVSSYIGDKEGNKTADITFTQGSDNVSTKYNKITTDGLKDTEIKGSGNVYVYVTFEINKDNDRNVILDTDKETAKYNHVEIMRYNTAEGLIDIDSIAGNYNPDTPDVNNEDDNGAAPGLIVKLKDDPRTLNGTVWEDERTEISGEAIVGNGILDNGETKINGVTVQLIEQKDDKGYIRYETKTNENGTYSFSNYIPGNYMVRFLYGNNKETVLTNLENLPGEKGLNAVSYNGQDYKSTVYTNKQENAHWYMQNVDTLVSDARDNWNRREEVNNYSKTLTNHIAEVLSSPYKTPDNREYINELIEKTNMWAYTDNMSIEVEYPIANTLNAMVTKYQVKNIDFGLAKRPTAELVLVKDVANVKLTLANGAPLFDSSDKDTNLLWIKPGVSDGIETEHGQVQLTVDDELIHGSTIEITYKMHIENKGEVDYEGQEFYYTGKYRDGMTKVTTKAEEIIDYVENNLSFNSENSLNVNWQIVQNREEIQKEDKTLTLVRNGIDLTSYSTIIKVNNDSALLKSLTPGEITEEETLVLTQTLTTSGEETAFDNSAEIIKVVNTNGRRLENSIPGNYNPTNGANSEELDTDLAENVVILPPFGQQIIYYVLGLILAIVVIGGIILIKKKVLK